MIDSSDGLFFSESGLENRSLFFSPLNDINIYVEDVGKEYIYEEIFERLFEGRIKLFSIFPLVERIKSYKYKRHTRHTTITENQMCLLSMGILIIYGKSESNMPPI